MRALKVAAHCVVFLCAAACGPNAPTPAPHDSAPIDAPPSNTSATASPTASTMGAEMQKGIEEIRRKDFAAAKATFQKVVQKEPQNGEAQFYFGVALENTKDKKGALAAYEAALKAKRDFDDAAANASALYIDEGRFDDAIVVLEAIDPQKRKNGSLALNLAVAYASKDDRPKAKNAFDLARRLAPREAMVLLTYGQWLGKWKESSAALVLKSAADAAPEDVGVLASVGFELKNVGAFAECIQVLDKAMSIKDAAELRTYRAMCKLGTKDKKGAHDDLLAATKSEPKYAPAHFYLGGRYAEANDFKKSAECYDTYLKLEPEGPLAKVAKERAKLARDKAKK